MQRTSHRGLTNGGILSGRIPLIMPCADEPEPVAFSVVVKPQRGASQPARPRRRYGAAGLHGLLFDTATVSEDVSDKSTGAVQLSSGKFAVIEQPHEFRLVPWRRPVIDCQLGREVMGVVQGGSESWQLGRQRGLGI